jgi:hypothetical protein
MPAGRPLNGHLGGASKKGTRLITRDRLSRIVEWVSGLTLFTLLLSTRL